MAPRVERKLAAILAADVVGYSRLVGADEAGTIARLKALRKEFIEPLIAEYSGRVVKLTGDGALVEFASAVDAVECAVAIQNGVAEREAAEPEERRIAFRIGINVGDIIVEDGDILGDGVNVAARLEGLAEPGGICVARNVYDQVKAKLALRLRVDGCAPSKNITEPLEVWRVALDGGRPPRKATSGASLCCWRRGPGGSRARRRVVWWFIGGAAVDCCPAARCSHAYRPAIAVLPFTNLTGDPAQDNLRTGHRGHHHRPFPFRPSRDRA